jgi:hypothetical protein
MRRKRRRRNATPKQWDSPWLRFDNVRTEETGGSLKLLEGKIVSLTIPAGKTHRDELEAIARQLLLEIESLDERLSETQFVRGKTVFRLACNEIDDIAVNYNNMLWWISKDGLNMANVQPAAAKISRFDDFAGKLYVDGSNDGKLSKTLLMSIAKALDGAGFDLKVLQPAQRKPLSEYNRKYAKRAIKTFERACCNPKFAGWIRRRLYVARERYTKANPSVAQLPKAS